MPRRPLIVLVVGCAATLSIATQKPAVPVLYGERGRDVSVQPGEIVEMAIRIDVDAQGPLVLPGRFGGGLSQGVEEADLSGEAHSERMIIGELLLGDTEELASTVVLDIATQAWAPFFEVSTLFEECGGECRASEDFRLRLTSLGAPDVTLRISTQASADYALAGGTEAPADDVLVIEYSDPTHRGFVDAGPDVGDVGADEDAGM